MVIMLNIAGFLLMFMVLLFCTLTSTYVFAMVFDKPVIADQCFKGMAITIVIVFWLIGIYMVLA